MNEISCHAETIFGAALSLDSPDERAQYLEKACRGDAALRAEVDALLADHAKVGHFLERPAIAVEDGKTVHVPLPERPGGVIGPYKLMQLIGEGGMGMVWMAEQKEPVARRVAVKVIKAGMDSQHVLARFEAEQQALALMDHPNIAKVLDAGTTSTGRPYFVMELVKGVPITQYCDERHLTLKERLSLFMPVCHAIQHAHQKGIIHRDIKPTNILVAQYDGQAVPKVIDFGVAKATAQALTEKTMFTEFGQVVGTLEYMSPEQAQMNQLDIDTRSDIYSLGVLLYELLTGATPFDKRRLRNAAFDEMLRIIREEEPPKPSTKLSTSNALPAVAANRHVEPASLTKLVRGDLDWIVMKALEKDRNRRYASANGLVRDLERYLHDEPVEASPPSARYKFMKFARKHRRAFATASLFALSLVAGVVVSAALAVRARLAEADALAQRDKTAQAQAHAEAVTNFLIDDILNEAAPEKNEFKDKVTVVDVLLKAAEKINSNQRFKNEPQVEASLQHVIGNTLNKLGLAKEAGPHLRRAVELRRTVLGPEDPETLEAQEDLAYFLTSNGDPHEAEALSRETYEARVRVLTPEHPKTLESLDTMCTALQGLGRYDDAFPLRKQCLEARRRVLGPTHISTLQSMNNLGVAYNDVGEFAEAKLILNECLKLAVKSRSPRHPETFAPRNSLGVVLLALGEFEEAERTLNEALNISLEVHGPKAWQTLHLQHVLVRILTGAGKLQRAEQLAGQTLAGRRDILEPGNPHIGRTLVALGLALVLDKKYQEADPLLQEAVSIFRDRPNVDDWIAQAQMCRGAALIGLGRAEDAEPLLADAWPKYKADKRILPWQKPRTIEAVAAAYDQAGKTAEAADWRGRLAAKPEP